MARPRVTAPDQRYPPWLPNRTTDAIAFTLYALATLTTLVRLYARGIVLRALGSDDVLITIATLIGAATTAGFHLKVAPLQDIYKAMKEQHISKAPPELRQLQANSIRATFGANQAYVFELMFIKLAVVAFYRRIAVSKRHHIVLYFTAALIIAYCLIHNIVHLFFHVRPIRYNWDVSVRVTKVFFEHHDLHNANSGFQSAIDVILLLYPIPILIKLKANHQTKVGLAIIFSLGIFSLSATLIRLSRSIKFSRLNNYVLTVPMQPELALWTLMEVNTAIICANLPAISALFRGFNRTRSTGASGSEGAKLSDLSEKLNWGASNGSSSSNSQTGFVPRTAGLNISSATAAASGGGGGDDYRPMKEPSVFVNERDVGHDIKSGPTHSNDLVNDSSGGIGYVHGAITRTTDFSVDVERGEKAGFL
ncbi:MAG: hypothetical protein M1816_003276 [Peltula sp. TS41687]|nr:MAG: hypothetical protein M1816_003276 [Peltula sp. TS41687]